MIPMVVTTNQKTAFFEILTPSEALYGVRTATTRGRFSENGRD